ncbi:MAG: phosphomethylpyrimidine synthase ThiC [bacterium]|jgi:phosphomethylpyrimidine synthase
MTTQLIAARKGIITEVMEVVARLEGVPATLVRDEIASGRAVLPANPAHPMAKPAIAGRAFRTKVNANLGRSTERSEAGEELCKLDIALKAGADFVMDLSVGADLAAIRAGMLKASPVPLGTVPMYEAISRLNGKAMDLTAEVLIQVIKEQAEQGVDFMTLHAGLLQHHVPLALKRKLGIVSRGGSLLAEWMLLHKKENPLFTHWDEIIEICRKHDVTVSLGDGLRPGCLADASDEAQFAELDTLAELVNWCRREGVQVMVEGPGHVPFNQIQSNMERQQKICDGAPFYVLGPVVTDIAPGYDHITSAIGATSAAYYGACLLCYVTPAEHLGLPTGEEVHQGVIAYRIAAHAADVARGLPGARVVDDAMADARFAFDWKRQFELSLDPEHARKRYEQTRVCKEGEDDHCSMCGPDFCAMRTSKRIYEHKTN